MTFYAGKNANVSPTTLPPPNVCLTPPSYHALFTLDHEAFVLVHSTDASDDVIVLVVRPRPPPSVVVAVVALQRI